MRKGVVPGMEPSGEARAWDVGGGSEAVLSRC